MKGEARISRAFARKNKVRSDNHRTGVSTHAGPLRIADKLIPVLDKIGVPEAQKFVPDPFQLEAISLLEKSDVVVTAPTGAGKTWIAQKAIEKVFLDGGRCWYACPLKALSNSIYSEFGEIFGRENLGILTGDRKENPNAPIIVGTTEILRNQLYDTMSVGEDLPVDLVIIDEAHYIGDEERGVVWEEVLIYLPTRVRLLLLSATIYNAEEIANWLTWLRGVPCKLICVEKRPVPIYPLFLFPEGELYPLGDRRGVLSIVTKKSDQINGRRRRGSMFPPVVRILNYLEEANLLPAIFFFKSRSDCDRAVEYCVWGLENGELPRTATDYDFNRELLSFLDSKPHLRHHRQLSALINARVGAHHGGQLPVWKVLLETMMKKGYLKAIFSTSTVAAGVNFPARTVVLFQSDRFNGEGFVELTSTELLQMTGRAGRRGMDRIGFVLVYPGPYQRPDVIFSLLQSPPGRVDSQIRVDFSMVLNLLLSHKPEEVMDVFANSLATYQSIEGKRDLVEKKERQKRKVETLLSEGFCHGFDEMLHTRQRYRELEKAVNTVKRDISRKRKILSTCPYLERGRLFRTGKNNIFVIISRETVRNRDGVRCWRLTSVLEGKSAKARDYWVKIEKITEFLTGRAELPENAGRNFPEEWVEHVKKVFQGARYIPVSELEPAESDHEWQKLLSELREAESSLETFPCVSCPLRKSCFEGKNSKLKKLTKKVLMYEEKLHAIQYRLWREFKRHLELLILEGYVTKDGELTPDGVWASRLRLDQPLLVSECIRGNVFPEDDPVMLSSLMAPFVNDRRGNRDGGIVKSDDDGKLYRKFSRLVSKLRPLMKRLNREGFPCDALSFWPAKTIYMWASGKSWDETRLESGVDEGDLAMLIFRTAENLRQLTSLSDSHPQLAKTAEEAIVLLLREPISYV